MLLLDTGLQGVTGEVPPTHAKAIVPSAEIPPARDRVAFLTADGQAATPLEQEAVLGDNDLLEASFLDRCLLVRRCVGRIRFHTPRGRSYATGFLIAPGILLTNHHVFRRAEDARGASVEFDFHYDVAGQLPSVSNEFDLKPERFFVADEALDFAAVAIADLSTTGEAASARGFLRLIPVTGKAEEGEFVTILQHPDGEPMRIALRENQITRLTPDEPFILYQADTAHGSSGAPVLNDSLQLVALHSGGRIRRDNRGRYALRTGGFADTLDGLGEKDVIWETNKGYRISRIAPAILAGAREEFPEAVPVIEGALRGGDVLGSSVAEVRDQPATVSRPEESEVLQPRSRASGAAMHTAELVVPLEIHVSVRMADRGVGETLSLTTAADRALESETLELRIPIIYDGLDERSGFDAGFLGLEKDAPAPKLTDKGLAVAAPLLDGSGVELRYAHFSVWMHRERRLALMTAANVDWRARKKFVEGKSTSRKDLAGFPKSPPYAEQWVCDPRIDPRHQLPDIFYTEDRKAFDKGHLVRRDDVCWGDTYAEIQMANGDTYHVTNCSPQTMVFNQGDDGEHNWGDLENYVQRVTREENEKAIIYAGPVFGREDRWFRGKDDSGPVRVQIPNKYWKIVVVKGEHGPEAYGFILKQDVTSLTEEEFYVTEEWKGALTPIADIQAQLRGWVSLDHLLPHDRFEAVRADLRP